MANANLPRLPEPTTVFESQEKQYLHELIRVLRISLDELSRNSGGGSGGDGGYGLNIDGGHADTEYGGLGPIDAEGA